MRQQLPKKLLRLAQTLQWATVMKPALLVMSRPGTRDLLQGMQRLQIRHMLRQIRPLSALDLPPVVPRPLPMLQRGCLQTR